jgi:hypothetical protein
MRAAIGSLGNTLRPSATIVRKTAKPIAKETIVSKSTVVGR